MVQPAAASSDTVSLPDWREGPPAAVLEAIVWLAVGRTTLTLRDWLRRDGGAAPAAAARHEATVLWRLSAVCRSWRTALCAAVERQATWTVTVQARCGMSLPALHAAFARTRPACLPVSPPPRLPPLPLCLPLLLPLRHICRFPLPPAASRCRRPAPPGTLASRSPGPPRADLG